MPSRLKDGLLETVDEDTIYTILNDDAEADKRKYFLSYCDGKTKDNFSMYLIGGMKVIIAIC